MNARRRTPRLRHRTRSGAVGPLRRVSLRLRRLADLSAVRSAPRAALAQTMNADEARRVALTVAARDTDRIPKVPGAGRVIEQGGVATQIMHNGVRVEEGCYYGAWMTEIIHRLRGHHEPQEEWAFHCVVERLRRDTESPVMVEFGSFWAYYSLWVAHELPGSRCVLVEPDEAHLQVGIRNFELNGLRPDATRHAAVGAHHGETIALRYESDGETRTVPVVSLDGLREELQLARVDLVLCDTQGAELDAIAGCAGAIRDRALRFMVVSTHHHTITGDPLTHQRCVERLTSLGAHILVEHTVHESASGDGLIVASFDERDAGVTIDVSRTRASDTLFGPLEPELAAAFDALRELRGAPAPPS
ncbi:MAG: FkbM family methyltransferase [Solirubrobacteraceae bacterium]|nr:FkbM family methyltransferase [Solirubrobacteraceae bacterium]